jgi:putative phage-type endonuclease
MLVAMQQRSPSWHVWRDEGLTASEMAVVMGLWPDKSPYRLWMEKTGRCVPDDLSKNPYVQAGIANEEPLRRHMEKIDDTTIFPGCYEYDDDRRFRASLDGLSTEDVVYELKWPSEKTWLDVTLLGRASEAYQVYEPQVQTQMMVTGAKRAKLVFGRQGENGIETVEFNLVADGTWVDRILSVGGRFLEHLANDTPPAKDPQKDVYVPVGDDAHTWATHAYQLRLIESESSRIEARLKTLKAEKAALLAPLKALMGPFKRAEADGVAITHYFQEGAINYRKIVEENLDLTADELSHYRAKGAMRTRSTITPEEMPDLTVDELSNQQAKAATRGQPSNKPEFVLVDNSAGSDWF